MHWPYPWSSVKSIIKKWKEYGSCVNLPRSGRPHKPSDHARRRQVGEATQDSCDYSEEVTSFSSSDGRDSAYNNRCPGSSPVKTFRDSGTEKNHHWRRLIWSLEFAKRHGGGLLVWWDQNRAFGPLDKALCLAVDGKINAAKYQKILVDNLIPSARELQLGRRFLFQQDNDTTHNC